MQYLIRPSQSPVNYKAIDAMIDIERAVERTASKIRVSADKLRNSLYGSAFPEPYEMLSPNVKREEIKKMRRDALGYINHSEKFLRKIFSNEESSWKKRAESIGSAFMLAGAALFGGAAVYHVLNDDNGEDHFAYAISDFDNPGGLYYDYCNISWNLGYDTTTTKKQIASDIYDSVSENLNPVKALLEQNKIDQGHLKLAIKDYSCMPAFYNSTIHTDMTKLYLLGNNQTDSNISEAKKIFNSTMNMISTERIRMNDKLDFVPQSVVDAAKKELNPPMTNTTQSAPIQNTTQSAPAENNPVNATQETSVAPIIQNIQGISNGEVAAYLAATGGGSAAVAFLLGRKIYKK